MSEDEWVVNFLGRAFVIYAVVGSVIVLSLLAASVYLAVTA
jgi:hypothetical protein